MKGNKCVISNVVLGTLIRTHAHIHNLFIIMGTKSERGKG